MDERARHAQFEDQFLSQLKARALALIRGTLPADSVHFEPTPEGADDLRARLARMQVYDRDLLHSLPGGRSTQLRFTRALVAGLFPRTISRVRVRVLAPTDALVRGEPGGPIGREEVLDALARYELLPARERPSAVVLGSATGFTPEARALVGRAGPTLVLMGGRPDGGWDVEMPPGLQRTPWAKLFALESQDALLNRLMYHLGQEATVLDSRGLSIREIAQRLGVPESQADLVIRRACRSNPQLMTVVHNGVVHISRTPLAEEGDAMSLWSRIRRLLRLKPTTAERVRQMTAQRVKLEQQRYEVDQRANLLEADERQVVERGAAAKTDVERKQLAGKLVRTRRDLSRVRAQARIFSQQIDILGTHIHHLTLAEQGRRLELPKAEELTREAAQAEQVMAELSANADLATQIEVGAMSPAMEEEEAAILAEFEQAGAQQRAAAAAPQDRVPTGSRAPTSPSAARLGEAGSEKSPQPEAG